MTGKTCQSDSEDSERASRGVECQKTEDEERAHDRNSDTSIKEVSSENLTGSDVDRGLDIIDCSHRRTWFDPTLLPTGRELLMKTKPLQVER